MTKTAREIAIINYKGRFLNDKDINKKHVKDGHLIISNEELKKRLYDYVADCLRQDENMIKDIEKIRAIERAKPHNHIPWR
jgi:hypothetical protein